MTDRRYPGLAHGWEGAAWLDLESIAAESMDAIRPYLEGATLVCEFRSNVAVAR